MKEIALIGLLLVLIVSSFFLGYWRGKEDTQIEIEYRAAKENLKGEELQKVERIIFNEVQL